MIDSWGEKVLFWLMEGPECGDNRGANPRAHWGSLEPYRRDILRQPWVVHSKHADNAMGLNRVYVADPQALLEYLLSKQDINKDDIDMAIYRHTLDLMGG